MTAIAFHFNAPAKLAYACRLLRKAAASGSTVAVVADSAMLGKLNEQLWTFSALDFVPHQLAGADGGAGAGAGAGAGTPDPATPVWLCEQAAQGAGRDVLLNLSAVIPEGFEQFSRVIEVVTLDEADRQSARSRWKQYTERGLEIVRHDLKINSESSH
jgi:DNA polymerase III subunit chi